MAARTVATTDTLNTFRTSFNSLSGTDIGDPATLATSAKTIVVRSMRSIRLFLQLVLQCQMAQLLNQ